MSTKPVVAVAMSGGVDSSVAAALLVDQGHQVIGMMLRLWSDEDSEQTNRCCSPDSMILARRVASILSIPFYVLDARQVFYETVVTPFIYDYTHNLTPNPCIACNRSVRWDYLLNHALASGSNFLATGHYARISQNSAGLFQIARAIDPAKDQSYVLHILTQSQLSHSLFPLGGYTKQEVRQLARKFNLPVAERLDSQDLCFIGENGDYRSFLSRHVPQLLCPGLIIDRLGNVLGQHQGLALFTIGQRKGLRLSSPTPLYVIEKDIQNNTLIVGTREQLGNVQLIAEKVSWIDGQVPSAPFSAQVKIRYKAQAIPGVVYPLDDRMIHIRFENLVRDITPGQAAVLYNGDICLGGGIISNQTLK